MIKNKYNIGDKVLYNNKLYVIQNIFGHSDHIGYTILTYSIDLNISDIDEEYLQPFDKNKYLKFKHGDILYSKIANTLCIFDKYVELTDTDYTFNAIYTTSNLGNTNFNPDCFCLATEVEKQILFDILAKQGKRWNEETCEIETFKWKPSFGEIYYYVDYRIAFSEFYVNFTYNREWSIDDSMIKQGKCFKTEEECQKKCDELNRAIKNI